MIVVLSLPVAIFLYTIGKIKIFLKYSHLFPLLLAMGFVLANYIFPWTPFHELIGFDFFKYMVKNFNFALIVLILFYITYLWAYLFYSKKYSLCLFSCFAAVGFFVFLGEKYNGIESYSELTNLRLNIVHSFLNTKERNHEFTGNINTYLNSYKNLLKNNSYFLIDENTITIWPESAMPEFAMQDPLGKRDTLSVLSIGGTGVHIWGSSFRSKEGIFNSLFFTHNSKNFARYDKQLLLPIGERQFLFGDNTFAVPNAKEKKVFKIWNDTLVVPKICYESLWPLSDEEINSLNLHGDFKKLIIVASNDFWFKSSLESRMIFKIHQYIVARYQLPLVNSSNGGWSYFIDSGGQVRSISKKRGMDFLSVQY